MIDTNYKDDKFTGKRKYKMIQNDDGTYSFEDMTTYDVVGTEVGAADFNEINDFLKNKVYPVGSVYISTIDKNPSEILGFGTWVRFAEGRTIIGAGTGTDVNGTKRTFNGGDIGGEYTHQLTVNELPSHSHELGDSFLVNTGATSVGSGSISSLYSKRNVLPTTRTSVDGGSSNHNNLQNYIVCFIFKRVT